MKVRCAWTSGAAAAAMLLAATEGRVRQIETEAGILDAQIHKYELAVEQVEIDTRWRSADPSPARRPASACPPPQEVEGMLDEVRRDLSGAAVRVDVLPMRIAAF